jgi:hypothetical protein
VCKNCNWDFTNLYYLMVSNNKKKGSETPLSVLKFINLNTQITFLSKVALIKS